MTVEGQDGAALASAGRSCRSVRYIISVFWFVFFFFFSSRRRHTRLQGDWSSDVCSSDLDLCCNPISCGAGCQPAGRLLIGPRRAKLVFHRMKARPTSIASPANLASEKVDTPEAG